MLLPYPQNGKFMISPDPRRGEIRMLWKANDAAGAGAVANNGGVLTFEWVDRRTTLPVTTLTIFPEDGVTYQRVWTGEEDDRAADRVYALQYGNNSDRRFFFWMQELTDVQDGEYARDINAYCSDISGICAKKAREIAGDSAVGGTAGGAGSVDSANLQAIMQGLAGGSAPAGSSPGGASGDALSAIVQNLTSGASAAPSATPAPTGTSATPNAPPRPEGSAAASAPGSAGAAAGGGGGAITRE